MTDSARPWWASGSEPGARVEPGPAAEDREPRERQRAAGERRVPRGDGPFGTDNGHATGHDDGAPRGHAHTTGNGHAPGHEHAADGAELGPGEVCQACPICTALRLVEEVRPDLLAHLTEAARHLTLAAKTIIDAQAGGFAGGGLQHIPLDDDPS